MFHFSIRDVLWLMVVAGLAIAWRVDHGTLKRQLAIASDVHSTDLKDMLHRDLILDVVEDVINKPSPDLDELRQYLKTNRYQVTDGDAQTPVPHR